MKGRSIVLYRLSSRGFPFQGRISAPKSSETKYSIIPSSTINRDKEENRIEVVIFIPE